MNDKADKRKPDTTVDSDKPIPVIEEELRLQTRTVEGASIRIIKKVDEEVVDLPVVSRNHTYSIEHIPINKYVDEAPPSMRYEGETMVISVLHEEVVLVRRLKLVEEIRVTPSQQETVSNSRVTLKKERIVVQKDPPKT